MSSNQYSRSERRGDYPLRQQQQSQQESTRTSGAPLASDERHPSTSASSSRYDDRPSSTSTYQQYDNSTIQGSASQGGKWRSVNSTTNHDRDRDSERQRDSNSNSSSSRRPTDDRDDARTSRESRSSFHQQDSASIPTSTAHGGYSRKDAYDRRAPSSSSRDSAHHQQDESRYASASSSTPSSRAPVSVASRSPVRDDKSFASHSRASYTKSTRSDFPPAQSSHAVNPRNLSSRKDPKSSTRDDPPPSYFDRGGGRLSKRDDQATRRGADDPIRPLPPIRATSPSPRSNPHLLPRNSSRSPPPSSSAGRSPVRPPPLAADRRRSRSPSPSSRRAPAADHSRFTPSATQRDPPSGPRAFVTGSRSGSFETGRYKSSISQHLPTGPVAKRPRSNGASGVDEEDSRRSQRRRESDDEWDRTRATTGGNESSHSRVPPPRDNPPPPSASTRDEATNKGGKGTIDVVPPTGPAADRQRVETGRQSVRRTSSATDSAPHGAPKGPRALRERQNSGPSLSVEPSRSVPTPSLMPAPRVESPAPVPAPLHIAAPVSLKAGPHATTSTRETLHHKPASMMTGQMKRFFPGDSEDEASSNPSAATSPVRGGVTSSATGRRDIQGSSSRRDGGYEKRRYEEEEDERDSSRRSNGAARGKEEYESEGRVERTSDGDYVYEAPSAVSSSRDRERERDRDHGSGTNKKGNGRGVYSTTTATTTTTSRGYGRDERDTYYNKRRDDRYGDRGSATGRARTSYGRADDRDRPTVYDDRFTRKSADERPRALEDRYRSAPTADDRYRGGYADDRSSRPSSRAESYRSRATTRDETLPPRRREDDWDYRTEADPRRRRSASPDRRSSGAASPRTVGAETDSFAPSPVVEPEAQAPAPDASILVVPAAPAPTEIYERLVQVGEGTYGKVYKAKNTETGALVALKRIRMEAEKDGFPVTAVREIKLLQGLRHENVVNLLEMMVSKGHVYMVFEYMDHDLTGVLHHPSISFTPAHLKHLMQQLLTGLSFVHRRGVLHRDLKGSNLLLSKQGELKIADFGLARTYARGRGDDYTNRVITQWYKPPELLFGATIYGAEVDVWSAGCIFLELFARRPVFQGQDEIHQLDVIFSVLGTPSPTLWPKVHDLPWYELVKPSTPLPSTLKEKFSKWLSEGGLELVQKLLSLNPETRPTADEALKMRYFVDEEPRAERPDVLRNVKGEWHEYESKKARKAQKEAALAAGAAVEGTIEVASAVAAAAAGNSGDRVA